MQAVMSLLPSSMGTMLMMWTWRLAMMAVWMPVPGLLRATLLQLRVPAGAWPHQPEH